MTLDLPKYFMVGWRPVKFLRTEDGGMNIQVYDWDSGEFISDPTYLTKAIYSSDSQEVTEEQFESMLAMVREKGRPFNS